VCVSCLDDVGEVVVWSLVGIGFGWMNMNQGKRILLRLCLMILVVLDWLFALETRYRGG
jgi:hypothetical protein